MGGICYSAHVDSYATSAARRVSRAVLADILGAILLTGYLRGAVAPRHRVRALIPFRGTAA